MILAFRQLLVALTALALVGCGGSENPTDSIEVDSPGELGPFGVGYTFFTPIDFARGDRQLLVDVWYPVDPSDAEALADAPRTEYPLLDPIAALPSEIATDDPRVSGRPNQTLLVFSHGFGGISKQSIGLMEALASHGFIVASPEHTGNSQFSNDASFDEAAADRVPDVTFVIDTMLARSASAEDPFFDRIRPDHIGVIGNSFGAMTAIGAVAGWAGADPEPRVAAIVPISAVIDGDMQSDEREGPNAGFTAEQLARIEVPVMLVGGTEDINVPIGNNALAFDQLVNAPRVLKVDIVGATHTHFANVCDIAALLIDIGFGPDEWSLLGAEELRGPYETTCAPDVFPITEATRLQNLYSVAFFRRTLFDEVGYEQYLGGEFAETEPAIEFTAK